MRENAVSIERVLILGRTGFIGGHVETAFLRNSPGTEIVDAPRVDLTVAADVGRLSTVLDDRTAVVITAGIKRQLGDSLDFYEQNTTMAINLCRVFEKHPPPRCVFVSSAAVYGEELDDRAITELTPVRPASYYGMAKCISECLLMKSLAAHGGSIVSLRPPLTYGPADRGSIYGPGGFTKTAIAEKTITLWGDGSELREFLYVEDLAEIVFAMTFHDYSGPLNCATGTSRTFRDVLNILEQQLGAAPQVDSRRRSRQKVDNEYDVSMLRRLLPDLRTTSLEEGIARTIADLRSRGARAA